MGGIDMHALRDVTVKSTADLERAFMYLGCRLLTLDETDLALFHAVEHELIKRGVIPKGVK